MPHEKCNINIDGFHSFSKCRKTVSQNSRRSSGGITILIKSTLKKGIKFLDKESSEEFVWYKLNKTFFNLKHDIFICTVYIPPQNSSRESRLNTDHFENLQNNIYKFASKGNIILCGDFNARIGIVEDFVDNKFLEDDKYITPSLDQRYSKDHHVNAYGKSLIDLCIGNGMAVLNGRTNGDLLGQFTCQTYNGASVIDYVVISHSLLSFVVGFNVEDITEFSHHSCLSFILQIKYPQNSGDTFKLTPHIKSFIWNESQKDALRECMSSNEVENKL